jgi:hypothetical protein
MLIGREYANTIARFCAVDGLGNDWKNCLAKRVSCKSRCDLRKGSFDFSVDRDSGRLGVRNDEMGCCNATTKRRVRRDMFFSIGFSNFDASIGACGGERCFVSNNLHFKLGRIDPVHVNGNANGHQQGNGCDPEHH